MADAGDLQSAVSMYIVLGDRVRGLMLDPDTVLAWFQGYIDLLQSFRLYNVATCVCKRDGTGIGLKKAKGGKMTLFLL